MASQEHDGTDRDHNTADDGHQPPHGPGRDVVHQSAASKDDPAHNEHTGKHPEHRSVVFGGLRCTASRVAWHVSPMAETRLYSASSAVPGAAQRRFAVCRQLETVAAVQSTSPTATSTAPRAYREPSVR